MKTEKIPPPPKAEVPVATIEVTQPELDLLTALINQCHADAKVGDSTVYSLFCELENAGGHASRWSLNKKADNRFISFNPKYTG